jgi:ATP-dependent protease ClpP protease subunit
MNRERMRARLQMRARADWYRISNAAGDGGPAEVVIYDEIGYWGVTAASFMDELRAITADKIDLRLNSPGGDVFDGIAIHNVLRSHAATVTTYVDSLAASIASVIALAGDRVVMQPHSQMMIHDAWGLTVGNADDMRDMASLLDRQSNNVAGIYAEKAGGTEASWREAMKAETWYTADEAVAAGLADEAAEQRPSDDGKPSDAKDRWDLSIFNHAGRDYAPAPETADPSPLDEEAPTGAPVVVAGRPRLGWLYA